MKLFLCNTLYLLIHSYDKIVGWTILEIVKTAFGIQWNQCFTSQFANASIILTVTLFFAVFVTVTSAAIAKDEDYIDNKIMQIICE